MKRFLATLTAAIMVLAFAGSALAAPPGTAPGKNPLLCSEPVGFDNCQTNGKTATITNSNGGAAVYQAGYNTSFYGVHVGLITNLSNNVSGSALGIDPHWSIPIDVGPNHDGDADYFLSVRFDNCNNGAGLVDVINDATCTIYVSYDPLVSYPNWSAFVDANANAFIAFDENYAFIIADGSGAPGTWTISNFKLGKPGK